MANDAAETPMKPVPMLDLGPEITELWDELNEAFQRVLRSGRFILGAEGEALEAEVADYLGVKHAIGVNSGTDALIISLRALGIGPGDEVITTPFTFFATAESISNVGATPVFVDIEEHSFNIDPELIEAAITPRTRAIMPVHLYGRPCSMNAIMAIARKHELFVVEDAAQSFGARYYSDEAAADPDPADPAPYTGTIGELGAFSFYPTKNLGAYGDAGMITTNDDDLALLARKLRTHGSIVPYQNEMLGYNSRLDEIQAAILRVKLPHVEKWNQQRRAVALAYNEALTGVDGVITPEVTAGHVFHQYTVRHRNRDRVRSALSAEGVSSNIYYPKAINSLIPYLDAVSAYDESALAVQSVLSLPISHGNHEKLSATMLRALQAV